MGHDVLFFGFVPDNKLYDHTDYHYRQKQHQALKRPKVIPWCRIAHIDLRVCLIPAVVHLLIGLIVHPNEEVLFNGAHNIIQFSIRLSFELPLRIYFDSHYCGRYSVAYKDQVVISGFSIFRIHVE